MSPWAKAMAQCNDILHNLSIFLSARSIANLNLGLVYLRADRRPADGLSCLVCPFFSPVLAMRHQPPNDHVILIKWGRVVVPIPITIAHSTPPLPTRGRHKSYPHGPESRNGGVSQGNMTSDGAKTSTLCSRIVCGAARQHRHRNGELVLGGGQAGVVAQPPPTHMMALEP
jgi:hypothetical protein